LSCAADPSTPVTAPAGLTSSASRAVTASGAAAHVDDSHARRQPGPAEHFARRGSQRAREQVHPLDAGGAGPEGIAPAPAHLASTVPLRRRCEQGRDAHPGRSPAACGPRVQPRADWPPRATAAHLCGGPLAGRPNTPGWVRSSGLLLRRPLGDRAGGERRAP
jgi:hypothetical protein